MKPVFALLLVGALSTGLAHGATVSEEFTNNPALNGRFITTNFGTETSFSFDNATKSLNALFDMDYSVAYYVSTPPFATPITRSNDVTFSFNFRVIEMDTRILPTAFIGLLTTNHVGIGGDGLTVALSSTTNRLPAVSAAVDQGPFNFGGDAVQLSFTTEYLAIGRYTASNLQFSVDVYGGSNFVSLIGRSVTYATNTPGFSVDRLGLQNGGGLSADQTNGSITVVVDNLFTPARPPVNLSVTNITITESDLAPTNAVFSVTLSSPSIQTVRVDYATFDATAIVGEDYLATTGTLVFPPGTTTQTVVVPIIWDRVAEPAETFGLVLSNAANANLVASIGIATILDDDQCLVSVTDAAVAEILGGSTNATFRVSLNLSNRQTVWVSFTTSNGTAVANLDYTPANGLIAFLPGETNHEIAINVPGDLLDETTETFFMNLTRVTNAACADCQGQGTITNSTPPPTIGLVDTIAFVTEGNSGATNVSLRVSLSEASGNPVTVCFSASNGTAVANADFLGTNSTLTIPAGQTSGVITLRVFGDRMFELEESFSLHLLCVTNAVLANTLCEIAIQNDDPSPSIDISDTALVERNSGSTNALFTVRLSNPTYLPVTADYMTVDGTATAPGDYIGTNSTLTFQPGSTSAIVSVSVLGDLLNEADESFGVILQNISNVAPGRISATCIITNDDFVCISIHDASLIEGNGPTNLVFTVSLSAPAAQQVTSQFITRNGNAVSPSDFEITAGILSFPIGVTTQFISVPIVGDMLDEPNETFVVALTNLTNGTFCQPLATGTIVDEDPPAISIGTVSLDEGNTGTTPFVFFVQLSSASTNPISVSFSTADNSAIDGSDYFGTNGVLTFAPGVISTTIIVHVVGDAARELDEVFTVNLNAPVNATIGNGQGIGTIRNDDSPLVNIASVTIIEGTCTNIVVSLSETSSLPVTIPYCLGVVPPTLFLVCNSNCVPMFPADVSLTCRSNCCTLTIPPGILSTNFQLCALRNGLDETNGIFRGDGGEIGGGRRGTNGLIQLIDVDVPVITATNAGIVEGNSGLTNLCFPVRLSNPHDTQVSVDFFTFDGGAASGIDYQGSTGTVIFAPGVTTQYVCVPVIGEILYETNEILFVLLTNAINGTLTNALLRGVITNDDAPPPLIISDVTVVEGDTGTNTAVFTVTVTAPTSLDTTVAFTTVDGSARNGFDFISTNGSLFFPVGTTSRTLAVPILGDTLDEYDETFLVRLSNPVNATLGVTNATGTIIDDDPTEIRVVGTNVVEGNSGSTLLAFNLRLSLTNATSITVDFFTRDDTALQAADYIATNGTLTFSPGESNKTVFVQILGEQLTELNETLFLCLTNAANARIIDVQGQGTIVDDDSPCLTAGGTTVQEQVSTSTNVIFSVTLDNPSSLEISVNYVISNGTANAGSDLVGGSGTLILPPGVTSTNIDIVVNSDAEVETNESFFIVFSNPINVQLCQPRATNWIVDGTIPPIITVSDSGFLEGNGAGQMVFTATLSKVSPQSVMVDFSTGNGSATAGSDYTSTSGTILFRPGITSTNFSIPVLGDCMLESGEILLVNLSNARLAVLGTTQVTGTITNDDAPPSIAIADAAARERDLDTTNLVFTLTLSCPSSFTAAVNYATTDATALAGIDYVTTNGVAILPPGVTTATVRVTVLGDFENEANETVLIILSDPVTAAIATNTAVGAIVDDDGIQVSIADAAPVNEGSTATLNVTLSKPPTSERSVAYSTADGSANGVFDYRTTNGVLRFGPGVTNITVTVATLSDGADETNENFFVTLSAPEHVSIARTQALATIIDGDPPCIFLNDVAVRDNGTGNIPADFSITLSSTSSLPISVRYTTTNGTAIAGPDYVPASGILTFPPGSTNAVIQIPVLGNTQDETNEYFSVILFAPTNAALCKPSGICTVFNGTNVNIPPVVALTSPVPNTCLTTPANLQVAADASDSDGLVLRVDFFANATNFIGRSFAPPYQVTWVNIPVGVYELTAVALDNAERLATSAPVHLAVSLPAVLSIPNTSVVEGNAGTNLLIVPIRLQAQSCQTVKVDVATSLGGTASPGLDYLLLPRTTVTFEPGTIQQIVSVPILGDTIIETDETIVLVLSNAINATIATALGTGAIINDDSNYPPVIVITNPIADTVFYTPPGLIPICAEARDSNGFVRQVDFYAGTNAIGSRSTVPYCITWTNHVPGTNVLTAIATDNDGAQATSSPVRMIVQPCGVLAVAPLPDQTLCVCEALNLTAAVTSSLPYSVVWRFNGEIIPGETGTNLTRFSLKPEHAGMYSVHVSTPCQAVTRTTRISIDGSALTNPVVYANTNFIAIPDYGAAIPSLINITCIPGRLIRLTVDLNGVTHDFPGDLDIFLVSPSQRSIKLMSDVLEDVYPISELNLTFGDGAPLLGENGSLTSGLFRPSDFDTSSSPDAIIPGTIIVTNLADVGDAVNGVWQLLAYDDATIDTGGISRGWRLTVEWDDSLPRLNVVHISNDTLGIRLASHAGRTHVLQGSINLLNWSPISTNVMTGTNMTLTVPLQPTTPHVFYRVNRCP